MPSITSRPLGLVISKDVSMDDALPTASIVTLLPPDSEFPIILHPVTCRTARFNSDGSTTISAPNSSASER